MKKSGLEPYHMMIFDVMHPCFKATPITMLLLSVLMDSFNSERSQSDSFPFLPISLAFFLYILWFFGSGEPEMQFYGHMHKILVEMVWIFCSNCLSL